MTNKLFLQFLILIISNFCYSQKKVSFNKISNLICKEAKSTIGKKEAKFYYNIRKTLSKNKLISQIINFDTIFLLEIYEFENGETSGLIWNIEKSLSYKNKNKKTIFLDDHIAFTKHMIYLVQTWNINEIRKEENLNSHFIPNNKIVATRIILSPKIIIETITFRDFFKIDRDSMR